MVMILTCAMAATLMAAAPTATNVAVREVLHAFLTGSRR